MGNFHTSGGVDKIVFHAYTHLLIIRGRPTSVLITRGIPPPESPRDLDDEAFEPRDSALRDL